MNRQQTLALVRKEWLEMTRTNVLPFLYNILLSVLLTFTVLKRMPSSGGSPSPSWNMTGDLGVFYTLLFVPPLVIPFTALMLAQKSILREQLLGSMAILLSSGIHGGDIWLAKVLASSGVGYLAMLVGLALNCGIVAVYSHRAPAAPLSLLVILLIVEPLACFTLVGLLEFMVYALRTTLVGGIFAVVLITVFLSYSQQMLMNSEILISAAYLVAVGGALVLCLLYMAMNQLPKRYLLRL